MAFRRSRRKFRRRTRSYAKRRSSRRFRSRRKVHYKVSKRKFSPRWADCALSKLYVQCFQVNNPNPYTGSVPPTGPFFDSLNMGATIDAVSVADARPTIPSRGNLFLLDIVPFINTTDTQNIVIMKTIRMGRASVSPTFTTADVTCTMPTVPELIKRYSGYRVMCAKFKFTVRPADASVTDADTGVPQTAAPLMLFGFPYQSDSVTHGNYWQGETTNTNPQLNVERIKNLKYAFTQKIQGFGTQKATMTKKIVWYPHKIYGMSKQQWLADEHALCIAGASPSIHQPKICVGVADYNPTLTRRYSVDVAATYYVRWEGQRFVTN